MRKAILLLLLGSSACAPAWSRCYSAISNNPTSDRLDACETAATECTAGAPCYSVERYADHLSDRGDWRRALALRQASCEADRPRSTSRAPESCARLGALLVGMNPDQDFEPGSATKERSLPPASLYAPEKSLALCPLPAPTKDLWADRRMETRNSVCRIKALELLNRPAEAATARTALWRQCAERMRPYLSNAPDRQVLKTWKSTNGISMHTYCDRFTPFQPGDKEDGSMPAVCEASFRLGLLTPQTAEQLKSVLAEALRRERIYQAQEQADFDVWNAHEEAIAAQNRENLRASKERTAQMMAGILVQGLSDLGNTQRQGAAQQQAIRDAGAQLQQQQQQQAQRQAQVVESQRRQAAAAQRLVEERARAQREADARADEQQRARREAEAQAQARQQEAQRAHDCAAFCSCSSTCSREHSACDNACEKRFVTYPQLGGTIYEAGYEPCRHECNAKVAACGPARCGAPPPVCACGSAF